MAGTDYPDRIDGILDDGRATHMDTDSFSFRRVRSHEANSPEAMAIAAGRRGVRKATAAAKAATSSDPALTPEQAAYHESRILAEIARVRADLARLGITLLGGYGGATAKRSKYKGVSVREGSGGRMTYMAILGKCKAAGRTKKTWLGVYATEEAAARAWDAAVVAAGDVERLGLNFPEGDVGVAVVAKRLKRRRKQ